MLVAAPLEPREVAADAVVVGGEAVAPEVGAEAEILMHRELAEDAAPLGDVRDSDARDLFRRGSVDPVAREAHSARGGDEPGDRTQSRRLARSVAAEHGYDLALPDAQRDAVQRFNLPVAGLHVVEHEERSHQSVVPR